MCKIKIYHMIYTFNFKICFVLYDYYIILFIIIWLFDIVILKQYAIFIEYNI